MHLMGGNLPKGLLRASELWVRLGQESRRLGWGSERWLPDAKAKVGRETLSTQQVVVI